MPESRPEHPRVPDKYSAFPPPVLSELCVLPFVLVWSGHSLPNPLGAINIPQLNMDRARLKKYELDKVALLGLFALGLGVAYLVVAARTHISFKTDSPGPYTGLELPVPRASFGQQDLTWQFVDNSFVLSYSLGPPGSRQGLRIRLEYELAAVSKTADEWISKKQEEFGGLVVEQGQMPLQYLTISWAHISEPHQPWNVYLGAGKLPDGRLLSVEIQELEPGLLRARAMFERVARGIGFQENQLLKKGQQLVSSFKSDGFGASTGSQSPQLFMIKNGKGRVIGFSGGVLRSAADPNGRKRIRSLDFYHIGDPAGPTGSHSLFEGAENVAYFWWVSQMMAGLHSRSTVRMELSENGILTVSGVGPSADQLYEPGPAAVPEVVLEHLIGRFVQSDAARVMVDVICADGRIVPTVISVVDLDRAGQADGAAYAVRLDFLDGQSGFEELYLDENKKIFRALLHRQQLYILERASQEELSERFPAWQGYMAEIERVLERLDKRRDRPVGSVDL